MSSRAHIAYYNPTEVERMYVEHISDKIEVEETEEEKVTTGVYAWLTNLAGKAEGEHRNQKIREVADKNLQQAVELIKEFIDNRDDIPPIGELTNKSSNYYKYSGRVTINAEKFHDADKDTIVEVTGIDDGVDFYAYTSFSNWVDGNSNSLLLHAAESGGCEYSITGLAHLLNDSPRERGYPVNFNIIYI